jgi:predicted MFS family arabinose efflux permease
VIGAASARRYVSDLKALDRRVLVVPLLFLVYVGGRTSITTFLAIYLVRDRGLDAAVVGLALLLENVVRALLAPVVGALSDRYGRRALLFGSAAASVVLAPAFVFVDSAPTLIAWAIVFGIAQAPFFPVGTALLLDLTPPVRHQTVLALNTSALNVGYTLAIAPAGFIAEAGFGWLALWGAGQFLAVTVAMVFSLRGPLPAEDETDKPRLVQGMFGAFRDPAFLWLTGLAFTFPLGLGLLISVVPLYAAELGWSVSTIGLLLAVNGVVVALFSVPVNVPLERFGAFKPLPFACLLAAVSELALREPTALSFLLFVSLIGLSEVVFAATLPAAIAALTPRGSRGAYQGAWAMLFSIGFGAPLVIVGLMRGAGMPWDWIWTAFAGATLVTAAALALSVRPLARRAREREVAATA